MEKNAKELQKKAKRALKKEKNEAAAQAFEAERSQLQGRVQLFKQELNKLKQLEVPLKEESRKVKQILKRIQSQANQIVSQSKEAEKYEKQTEKTERDIKNSLEEATKAVGEFKEELSKLERVLNQKEPNPAELIIGITQHVASVFNPLIRIKEELVKIYGEDTLPFIEETTKIIKESVDIERSLTWCEYMRAQLSRAYAQLNRMAISLIANKKSIEEQQIEFKAERLNEFIAKQAQARGRRIVARLVNTHNKLQTAVNEIKKLILELKRDSELIKQIQEFTLDVLVKLGGLLRKHIERTGQRIKGEAEKFKNDIKAAFNAARTAKARV
ncbi:hypothetical protein DRJ25_06195 [Candidatus Woesearchaeota archaeon]|nr:MAG: hypothetical protein DRJ25_06195 [Candidatus Woesearchaeota archaeon]